MNYQDQPPLFNFQILSSTRQMNAAQHAREKAGRFERSLSQDPLKSHVPTAPEAVKSPMLWLGNLEDIPEMMLPGEDRQYGLGGLRCDTCYRNPQLDVTWRGPFYPTYKIFCHCGSGPEFKTSQEAIQHFRLTQKLSEL